MLCYICERLKRNGNDTSICNSCEAVCKTDIVRELLNVRNQLKKYEANKIYLSEQNRHKKGRPTKLNFEVENEIKMERIENPNKSYSFLAEKYGVSKGTIYNIIHNKLGGKNNKFGGNNLSKKS